MNDENSKKRNVSFYIDDKMIDELDREAVVKGTNRNQILLERLKGDNKLAQEETGKKPTILVLASHKGGVAKTITAANLAVAFAQKGKKTLAIDLDGQGSLSEYFNVYDEDAARPCIKDVLIPDYKGAIKTLAEVKVPAQYIEYDTEGNEEVYEIENLEVVPSDIRFDGADLEISNRVKAGPDTVLSNAIETLIEQEFYDYIIIDCPPRVDLVTTNAITSLWVGNSRSMIIVPVRPDGFSRRGMISTVDAIKGVALARKSIMPRWMLLKTIYESRTNLAKILEQSIAEVAPKAKFFNQSIGKAVVVMESSEFFKPLAYYDADSKPWAEYKALAKEIEEMADGE